MSRLTSNAIDTITKPIKYVNCFFSVTHFGLGHEGGVDIPKLKHWVLTPKSDKLYQKSMFFIAKSQQYPTPSSCAVRKPHLPGHV